MTQYVNEDQAEKLESEEFQAALTATVDEQRKRLSEKNEWWPDLVFFVRDIQTICQILTVEMDAEKLAEHLAKVVGSTIEKVIERAYPGISNPAKLMLIAEVRKECEFLNAITEQLINKEVLEVKEQ